jgi:hypothetical protein
MRKPKAVTNRAVQGHLAPIDPRHQILRDHVMEPTLRTATSPHIVQQEDAWIELMKRTGWNSCKTSTRVAVVLVDLQRDAGPVLWDKPRSSPAEAARGLALIASAARHRWDHREA